jgi:glycolate oxidase FAD binding subunit
MPTGLFMERGDSGEVRVTARFAGIPESVEAQVAEVERLLGPRASRPSPGGEDLADESGGRGTGGTPAVQGAVLKISVLPTEIAMAIDRAVGIAADQGWRTHAVAYAHGLGRITWLADETMTSLPAAVNQLRAALAPSAGTVVVLDAPLEVKREMDVWGPEMDAVPIMRRVKAELDPHSTLNPGRLIGGI